MNNSCYRSAFLLRPVLGALLAVILLGGCLGYDGESRGISEEITSSLTMGSESRMGILDEYLFQIFGPAWHQVTNPQELQEMRSRVHRERNDFIVACMLEQGFTYTPTDSWLDMPVRAVPFGVEPYGTRNWVELWGFGISTEPPNSPGWRLDGIQTGSAGIVQLVIGQHQDISQAELTAWYQAMYGIMLVSPPPEVEFTQEGYPWPDAPVADLGCETRWIQHQVLPPTPFRALQDEIERFDSMVELDPRTLALNASWASCMIDAGGAQWGNPRNLTDHLLAEYSDGQIPVEVFLEWDWEIYPDGPPPVDRAEFREREIALALADWDCREQLEYDAARQVITFDLQQQFVNKHRNELAAWVEYADQQRIG